MSRGHGSVQRAILATLHELRDGEEVPPLTWFTQTGLGITEVARSAYSRAAIGLQRAGLIERAVAWVHSGPSTNPYYRHAREPVHPDDMGESFQGPRLRLIVRLTADASQEAEWEAAWERWDHMNHRSPMYMTYLKWLVASDVDGAVAEVRGDADDIYPLSVTGSKDEVSRVKFATSPFP